MEKSQKILASSPFGIETYPSAPPASSMMHPSEEPLPGYSKRGASPPLETITTGAPIYQLERVESSESLYQASSWAKLWFLRLMILTVARLLLFVRKIYEDYSSTIIYYNKPKYFGHFIISFSTLFLPTIIFTTYRVARYLQVQVFPRLRASQYGTQAYQQPSSSPATDLHATMIAARALPRLEGGHSTPINSIDDGLVTARESPNLDDTFQQVNQPQIAVVETNSLAPSTAIIRDNNTTNWLEESSRELPNQSQQRRHRRPIALGIGEQLLHGVLFVFWKLKKQVDVIGFLVERACLWRKPRQDECDQLQKLQLGSDGLEWFQDFYAAFLAILVQVYTLGLEWPGTKDNTSNNSTTTVSPNIVPSNNNGLASAAGKVAQGDGNKLDSIVRAAGGAALNASQDMFMITQLIISSAIVVSLLLAIRRRDDGPLTLTMSMIGWGSLFTARIIVLALAVVNLGSIAIFLFTMGHILFITSWIFKIAMDSHNNKPGESEEFEWNDEENELKQSRGLPELNSTTCKESASASWSKSEKFTLLVQVFILFGIPSVFYWPIMFNLKLHYRPFKYLVLVMSQNFILIATILLLFSRNTMELYLLAAAAGLTVSGFIFISFYYCCKPSLTEYFARADELFNEADRSGVYFEFCSRIFKMPDLSKNCFRRLMNQCTEIVESED